MKARGKDSVRKHYVFRSRGIERLQSVRPHFLNFHRLSMEGDYDYPEHRHREYELILVRNGPYLCELNAINLEISDGRVLMIKPGDLHRDLLHKGQSHFVLHFMLNQPLFRNNCRPGIQQSRGILPDAEDLFHQIEKEADLGDPFSSALQDSFMEILFWKVVRHLPEEALSASFISYTRREEFINRLYDYFMTAQFRHPPVEEMAASLGISKRTLTTRCREYLGDSPARLFLCFRLEQSCDMLRLSDLTIKEISRDTGFDNPFNFSRSFRRLFGVSPSEYRSCE